MFLEPFRVTLAQLGKRQSAEREYTGSNPGQTNTKGLSEKKVLPL